MSTNQREESRESAVYSNLEHTSQRTAANILTSNLNIRSGSRKRERKRERVKSSRLFVTHSPLHLPRTLSQRYRKLAVHIRRGSTTCLLSSICSHPVSRWSCWRAWQRFSPSAFEGFSLLRSPSIAASCTRLRDLRRSRPKRG